MATRSRLAPMLAGLCPEPFDSPDHLFEVKWDGTRCIAFVEAAGLRLQNRRFAELGQRYPELAGLASCPPGTAIDGEIVVLEDGKPSFPRLMQREHLTDPGRIARMARQMPVTYMVFDLLTVSGTSLLGATVVERKARLADVVEALDDPHIVLTDHVMEQGCAYFAAAAAAGLEGIMAKRSASPYQPGRRTDDWLKIKVAKTEEFDIIGFHAKQAGGPLSALLIARRDGAAIEYVGKVGSGFTERQRQEYYRHLSACPAWPDAPAAASADGSCRITDWRCRVRYFEQTAGGMLRGPVFLELM